jgi:hypothetical protein
LMIGLMFGPVVWFALLMGAILLACFTPERWIARLAELVRLGRSP